MTMVNLFKDLSYALSGDMFNTNEPVPFTMPEGDHVATVKRSQHHEYGACTIYKMYDQYVYIYDNHPQFISFHTSADTFEEDNL